MKGMKAILLLEGLELVDAFIIYYIEFRFYHDRTTTDFKSV